MTPSYAMLNDATKPLQKNVHIEIVASSNPRLNAMARDSQLTIQAVLRTQYSRVEISIVNTMEDLKRLVAKKPDLVVLGMKLILLDPEMDYDQSRKVWLSDYLTEHTIEFTGSQTSALTLEFDKQVAKQCVLDNGLLSARYFVSELLSPIFHHDLTYPLFVKPTNRGDSKGIDDRSIVHTQNQLDIKIMSIHSECSSNALIEEYLSGREFSIAVIRTPYTNTLNAFPVEITAPANATGDRFLSEAVKDADSEVVSAVLDPKLRSSLQEAAIGVFKALGSRDYGRIDMRLDADGQPNFIEANLMPGLSTHGYLARCFSINNSFTYPEIIMLIVGLSLERHTSLENCLISRLIGQDVDQQYKPLDLVT